MRNLRSALLSAALVLSATAAIGAAEPDNAAIISASFGDLLSIASACHFPEAPVKSALERYFETIKASAEERARLTGVAEKERADYSAKYPNQDCVKMGSWYDLAIAENKASGNLTYNPTIPWQTRQGALLCQNYFAMKEARAAVKANDRDWLARTGCVIARSGLKIDLIEAPHSQNESATWQGRVRTDDGQGTNVYFDEYDALTFAISHEVFSISATAENYFLEILKDINKKRGAERGNNYKDLPHGSASIEGTRLGIGPATLKTLDNFCDHDHYCKIIGKTPR